MYQINNQVFYFFYLFAFAVVYQVKPKRLQAFKQYRFDDIYTALLYFNFTELNRNGMKPKLFQLRLHHHFATAAYHIFDV
jgi:hypothetical protein